MLIMRFKVMDRSMEPAFSEGNFVVVNKLNYIFQKPKIKDVVVVEHNRRFLLKRIVSASFGRYFVQGDNKKYSNPIEVERKQIIGKVLLHIRR